MEQHVSKKTINNLQEHWQSFIEPTPRMEMPTRYEWRGLNPLKPIPPRAPKAIAPRYRAYCGTLNNYTQIDEHCFENMVNDQDLTVNYIIYGYEKGDNGTPHLQFYMELTKPSMSKTVRVRMTTASPMAMPRKTFPERLTFLGPGGP